MIELCGKRIVLRTLEREHCRILWQQFEPAQPVPTESLNPGLSVEGADKWFEDMQARQGRDQVYLGVFMPNGALLGDVQLASIDWRYRTASIGLGITCRAERGKGYGTDAALTLLRYAFAHLDLYRVWAATAEHNTAAQHVLSKCGFAQEGREREAVYCAGRRWDRLIYGLLRPDYERVSSA